ncbi:MAG: HEAT repeat domain-containing protein [Deltaproteobacteria bacterium]|nr:HEAT repeat domain-containing protein [Deltaproteobacteria bacterium]
MIILSLCFHLLLNALPPPELLSQNKDFWISQLRSDSVDLKINALQKLGELRQADIPAKLSDVVRDSSGEVRFQALRTLAKIPNADSLKVLQDQLGEEKDPYLLSEVRRSIQSVEENLKLAAQKLEEKEAKKNNPAKPAAPKTKATKKQ